MDWLLSHTLFGSSTDDGQFIANRFNNIHHSFKIDVALYYACTTELNENESRFNLISC